MNDTADLHNSLADLKRQVEQDKIATFDAIRHVRDRAKSDERRLSDDHYLRCLPINKQIEAIERALLDIEAASYPFMLMRRES